MPIPDYQTIMLPILESYGDKREHYIWDILEKLVGQFGLTSKERHKELPSGGEIFYNRVEQAHTFMKEAGLIESTSHAYFRITNRGLETLDKGLQSIDNRYLSQFKEFREFFDTWTKSERNLGIWGDSKLKRGLVFVAPWVLLVFAFLSITTFINHPEYLKEYEWWKYIIVSTIIAGGIPAGTVFLINTIIKSKRVKSWIYFTALIGIFLLFALGWFWGAYYFYAYEEDLAFSVTMTLLGFFFLGSAIWMIIKAIKNTEI